MTEQIKLREDVLEWRDVDGEIVALDLSAREYISINKTGAAVWPLLAAGATTEQLAGKLVEEFGIDGETAERDATAFLDQLRERDLLDES
ncbi:MAG: PqqD family protein [Solirubrobacterales bacterium]